MTLLPLFRTLTALTIAKLILLVDAFGFRYVEVGKTVP